MLGVDLRPAARPPGRWRPSLRRPPHRGARPASSGPAGPRSPTSHHRTPADYREWSTRLATVLADAEVRAGTFEVPVGRLTGNQVIVLRSVEHFLHGWDLAKAGGAPTIDLEPVATALDGPARQLLAAVGDRALAERRPFAPPVDIGADATSVERLVAAFGRDPGWTPDPVAGYARITERFVRASRRRAARRQPPRLRGRRDAGAQPGVRVHPPGPTDDQAPRRRGGPAHRHRDSGHRCPSLVSDRCGSGCCCRSTGQPAAGSIGRTRSSAVRAESRARRVVRTGRGPRPR